ncbi:glycoside hydrolase family 5 protein [Cnuibacter sp. UC19_7]|uniref:glycoside hydrolase family 5 protein n=1 Tax=Cnuibacter sp. UC19_7 TaxID=3350166 RepID=UPI00367157D6
MTRRSAASRVGGLLVALVVLLAMQVGGAPAPATAATALAPTVVPAAAPVGPLHTSGSTIVAASGQPFVIKAASWFGMETSTCSPHGLWAITLDEGMAHLASMGFNTVRVPFSNECIEGTVTTSIGRELNPSLVNLSPLQLLDAVVAAAGSHGLSVILDRHRPDSQAQSGLWYTDRFPESTWIADWQMLAARYAGNPTVIGADLHNEPHDDACWACGDPAVDWRAAAERGGDAVLAANPDLLIIVEGVARSESGDYTWWGGSLADASDDPVRLDVPHRVVYSPHEYPASVYPQPWFSDPDYPANLPGVWNSSWGYLVEDGIAPVFVGEFGTGYTTASDQQWLSAFVQYLAGTGTSFGYWSFNPDSGDTGGLVADDWRTPEAAKLAALEPLLGPYAPPVPRGSIHGAVVLRTIRGHV